MVGQDGLEPSTFRFGGECEIRFRFWPTYGRHGRTRTDISRVEAAVLIPLNDAPPGTRRRSRTGIHFLGGSSPNPLNEPRIEIWYERLESNQHFRFRRPES